MNPLSEHDIDVDAASFLTTETSPPVSAAGRRLGRALRYTARPLLGGVGVVCEYALRHGPSGIETWAPIGWLINISDLVGLLLPAPRGTAVEVIRLPHCRAEWVTAKGVAPGTVMVYLHGGAFVGCGLRTHRRLVARLSAACDAQVLNVDYRMLPRNTINDSLSDALAAYQQVLRDGTPAERTVFAGDSAGGGLVLLTALAAREAGLPQPAALVAISPWANMDVEALVSHRNTDVDAVIPPRALRVLVERLVRRGLDLDPRLSAIGADLSGLPRTLIHVGTEEVLELDAQTLAEELAHAGVPTHLKLWTGLFHVFPVAADLIPEARDSIADIGAFVRSATRLQPRSRRT